MGRTENSVAEALGQTHVALLADLRELEQVVRPSSGEGLAEGCHKAGAERRDLPEALYLRGR